MTITAKNQSRNNEYNIKKKINIIKNFKKIKFSYIIWCVNSKIICWNLVNFLTFSKQNILRILKDIYLKSENNNLNQFKFKYKILMKKLLYVHIWIVFYDVVYFINDIFRNIRYLICLCGSFLRSTKSYRSHCAPRPRNARRTCATSIACIRLCCGPLCMPRR